MFKNPFQLSSNHLNRLNNPVCTVSLSLWKVAGALQSTNHNLVAEYFDIFALDISELGWTDVVSHTINTGDNHYTVTNQMHTTYFTWEMEGVIENVMAQGVK